MSDRLPSALLVGALLRRVNDAGGIGAVRTRGHPEAGAILIITSEKGRDFRLFEPGHLADGRYGLRRHEHQNIDKYDEIENYWQRRRCNDPDLWVIELDIAEAERFAAETIVNA